MSSPKLSGGRFEQADYVFHRYAARVPVGTTLEDVLHPDFFQNHLSNMRPGMRIEVLSDDNSLDCDLRVLTVTKTTAHCRLLRHFSSEAVKQPDIQLDESEGIKVNFGGPHHKWRVMRANEVIQFGFGTKEEADAYGKQYVAQLADPAEMQKHMTAGDAA